MKDLANKTALDVENMDEKVDQIERDLRRGYTIMIEDTCRGVKEEQKRFDDRMKCELMNQIKRVDTICSASTTH